MKPKLISGKLKLLITNMGILGVTVFWRSARSCIHKVSVALLILMLSTPTLASERVAFIVGNSNYADGQILSIEAEVESLARLLRERYGFNVMSGVDLNPYHMSNLASEFQVASSEANIIFFYYAGHGLTLGGKPQLVPVDAGLHRRNAKALISLEDLFNAGSRRAKFIGVLDTCWKHNLARGWGDRLGRKLHCESSAEIESAFDNRGLLYSLGTIPAHVRDRNSDGPISSLLEALTKGNVVDVPSIFENVPHTEVFGEVRMAPVLEPTGVDYSAQPTQDDAIVITPVTPTPEFIKPELPQVLTQPKTAFFLVAAEPPDSTIRITNIKPRYRNRMPLTVGLTYQIEVTKPGYKSWNKAIYLAAPDEAGEYVVQVNLEKIPKQPTPQNTFTERVVVTKDPPPQATPPPEITQSDMALVYSKFEDIQEAINARRTEALEELIDTPAGFEKVRVLMEQFVVIETELLRLSNNAARGEITSILRIKRLVRPEGGTVFPGPALRDINLKSTRVSASLDGWSTVGIQTRN